MLLGEGGGWLPTGATTESLLHYLVIICPNRHGLVLTVDVKV